MGVYSLQYTLELLAQGQWCNDPGTEIQMKTITASPIIDVENLDQFSTSSHIAFPRGVALMFTRTSLARDKQSPHKRGDGARRSVWADKDGRRDTSEDTLDDMTAYVPQYVMPWMDHGTIP